MNLHLADEGDGVADDPTAQPGIGANGHGAFAEVFDGDSPGDIEPYVRLVPPDGQEAAATGHASPTRATLAESTRIISLR